MIETIWENNNHKTIAKQQVKKELTSMSNFSNTLNNSLQKEVEV